MTFAKPGWNAKKFQGILSAANPVPILAIPNIHEAPSQAIQGGAPNEHYHLDAYEYTYLNWLIAQPLYQEPIFAVCELVLDTNGDWIRSKGPVYVPA